MGSRSGWGPRGSSLAKPPHMIPSAKASDMRPDRGTYCLAGIPVTPLDVARAAVVEVGEHVSGASSASVPA
jgi:hypothetical protein